MNDSSYSLSGYDCYLPTAGSKCTDTRARRSHVDTQSTDRCHRSSATDGGSRPLQRPATTAAQRRQYRTRERRRHADFRGRRSILGRRRCRQPSAGNRQQRPPSTNRRPVDVRTSETQRAIDATAAAAAANAVPLLTTGAQTRRRVIR